MVLEKAGCVRAIDLREDSTIIYNVDDNDDELADGIKSCAQNHNMGQWQSRTKMSDGGKIIDFIYVSWQTHVFGFIDDMFIGTERDPNDENNRIVNI